MFFSSVVNQLSVSLFIFVLIVGDWWLRLSFASGLISVAWTVSLISLAVFLSLYFRAKITNLEYKVLLSSLLFGLLLSVTTFWLIDPFYSGLRVLISFVLLSLCFIAVNRFSTFSLNNKNILHSSVNYGLGMFFLVLLIGYLFIPEFRSGPGSLRLSGGINPNTVGMYSFYTIIWTSVSRSIVEKSKASDQMLTVLATICLFLSFSRSAWLATAAFFLVILLMSLNLKVNLRTILRSFICIIIIGFWVYVFWEQIATWFSQIGYLKYLENRFLVSADTDVNFLSRQNAWNILLNGFYASPLIGYFGWYNSSNFLFISLSDGVASSSHSLHIRLLSEVGLLGYLFVLGTPIVAILRAFYFAKSSVGMKHFRESEKFQLLMKKIASGLIAILFVREVFEDSYMVGYLGLTTIFVLLLCSFALQNRSIYLKNVLETVITR